MDSLHKYPSTSSASALASRSIRHRGLSPRIPQESTFSSPGPSTRPPFPQDARETRSPSTPAVRVEDTEDPTLLPAILLEQRYYQPSPLLPFTGHQSSKQLKESKGTGESYSDVALDAVPLTPRPDLHERSQSSASHATRLSQIPRLPSPDFSASRASHTNVFDFFRGPSRPRSPRRNSLASNARPATSRTSTTSRTSFHDAASAPIYFLRNMRIPSMGRFRMSSFSSMFNLASGASPSRPHQDRSDSASSSRSYGSSTSTDSGRAFLVSGVETTDKFTHRWPKPSSVKKIARRGSSRNSSDFFDNFQGELASEDFDVGLGFEHVGRWTNHKWCLLLSVMSVFGYSIAALVYSILTWYQTWEHADVMLVADADILILVTLCASLLLLAALVGLTGTLLNSRPLLAVYAILLWPALISLLSVGYVGYKRSAFALDLKLNLAWSQWYTDAGRGIVQDSLRCCGFADATHEATFGAHCYPRTPRPGCKGPLLRFERGNLGALWRAAFAAVPLHLVNVVTALLCANHVTRVFGKGLVPRQYRLRAADVRADAHRLLMHFAKDGAARLPPPMARTESGLGCSREDRECAHERVKWANT